MATEPTQWSQYLAKGVSVNPRESIPTRKEINEVAKSDVELNLLLEGLAKFQNERQATDPKSWFQIAGIHGKPYTTWPNEDWNKDERGNSRIPQATEDGFCTHNSILFLTWHRPYLALFESVLHEHVKDYVQGIPDDFEQKPQYVKGAESFRLPYWDWASSGHSSVPDVAMETTDARKNPPPSKTSWFSNNPVYNPLHEYRWPKGAPQDIITDEDTIPESTATVRHPWGPGEDALGKEIDRRDFGARWKALHPGVPEKNLTERTAYILQSYKRYFSMSNNRAPTNGRTPANAEIYGSLEDTHNAVHGLTGGSGHMSDPKVAAFDPIFWLHHANIDRLFAIWQGLHDDRSAKSWVTPLAAGWPNWTTEAGTIEDMNTKLYPFRPSARDKEDWYTSENTEGPNSVKRTEAFGYTYPETASLTYPVLEEPRKALFKRVSDIYPSPPREIRRSRAGISEAGAMFLPQAKVLERIEKEKVAATHSQLVQLSEKLPEPEVLLQQSLGSEKPFLKDLAPKNEYLEWLVNIKAERHSLGGNYSVHVFLNDVQEDNVALWPVSPHHVGSFMPFGQSSNTGCANCKNQQAEHLEITGQIPLTIALIERYLAGIIGDITEATVVPYLTKNLHWRVESGGTVLDDRSRVDGLTVFVVSNKVTLPEDDSEPPIYDDNVTVYRGITTKVNGGGRGDGTGLTAI